MKQPKPVVFLAAELAASCDILPGRAGILADQLCRIGRTFHATAVRIANGLHDPEHSRAEAKLRRLESKASGLVQGLPVAIERGALHLAAASTHKRRGGSFTERTSLL